MYNSTQNYARAIVTNVTFSKFKNAYAPFWKKHGGDKDPKQNALMPDSYDAIDTHSCALAIFRNAAAGIAEVSQIGSLVRYQTISSQVRLLFKKTHSFLAIPSNERKMIRRMALESSIIDGPADNPRSVGNDPHGVGLLVVDTKNMEVKENYFLFPEEGAYFNFLLYQLVRIGWILVLCGRPPHRERGTKERVLMMICPPEASERAAIELVKMDRVDVLKPGLTLEQVYPAIPLKTYKILEELHRQFGKKDS